MVLIPNDTQHPFYTRNDLRCMNMLLHPIWVFDIDNKSMFWANSAALEHVWNADTLDELIQRDFASDMSDAAASIMVEMKNKILLDPCHANIIEQWTLYPRGVEHAVTIDITCSGIRIVDCGNPTNCTTGSSENEQTATATTIAILVEAEMLQKKITINESRVRSIDLLKHIPVAISQFTMDGAKLIYQNTKSSQLFRTAAGSELSTTDLNCCSEELNADIDANAATSSDDADASTDTTHKPSLDEAQHEPITTKIPTNELLERFVDKELGQKAIAMIAESDEEFSAEVQQNTAAVVPVVSMERLKKLRQRRKKDDCTSQQEQRWFNVSLRKTRDPVTSNFVILYIARDISDIVKARNDSLRAAMKSEFLDVMAHEIRTPLHQIIGHIDLLEDTATNSDHVGDANPLNSEQITSVRQIQSSCSLLMSIINDLLDCSKLENGKVLKEEIPFDLDVLISSCVNLMRPRVQSKKGLQLSYHIDTKCGTSKLISDPCRLRQILHNLLSNAIKFSSVGSVTVTVQPFNNKYSTNDTRTDNMIDPLAMSEGSSSTHDIHQSDGKNLESSGNIVHLQFEISDNGIGIALDEQGIVFERYRQANVSISNKYGGTGLGLPICKALVELLGGSIGLHSKVGIGTTVYFDIPFKIPQSKCSEPQAIDTKTIVQCAAQNEPIIALTLPLQTVKTIIPPQLTIINATRKLEGLDVLVVEDNEINQKVVSAMLKRLGHIVSIAENGEIALMMMRQKQFQLILMDVQMPVMDGIECTKYIRNVFKYDKKHLPIIGLTAGYQPSERDYYENEVGMNTCVGKPLPMNKLKEIIETYCHRHQPNQQQDPIADLSTNSCITTVDAEKHLSNFSLITSMSDASNSTPVITTLKRAFDVSEGTSKASRTDWDLGNQRQHQSSGKLEPAIKRRC